MTREELLTRFDSQIEGSKAIGCECSACDNAVALRAVVELHNPIISKLTGAEICNECSKHDLVGTGYPCPSLQVIEKNLLK